jgi:endonuclease IV
METDIEVNSLSVQGSEINRPLELIVSEAATSKMLENCQKALGELDKNIPNLEKGISLHSSTLINLKQVQESNVPITSVDTPDLAYPSEAFQTIIERPGDLLNHIAWRLNSTMGWSKKDALERSLKVIEKTKGLEPFKQKPFIRVSLDKDVYQLESLVRNIPDDYVLAIEYNAEAGFTVGKYLEYVKNLNKRNGNIGLSIDPAHLFEYYSINEGNPYPKEATMNTLENIFKQNQESPILSVDINNLAEKPDSYGQTHKVFNQGVLNLDYIVESYKEYMKRNSKDGRIVLEFSPKDLSLFFDSNSNAALMSTIKKFS